ncbi:MAG: MFS transporter [Sandaracinaceae bacterium]
MAESDLQARTPFWEQVRSFGSTYWIANWMELVERFAYYGVRNVLPVFAVLAISEGGPEITHVQKGEMYAMWALVQSFVPIFSGAYADRFGFKVNIAVATGLKIVGYLLMGYCTYLAAWHAGMPLGEARALEIDRTYEILFAGAMLVALGTAIFKPGLQGLIAQKMPEKSASLGWGLFYQMVNIGGFLGPFVAGYLRVLSWEQVFLVCAAGVALNFIPLFFFAEPEREGEPDRRSPVLLFIDAMRGLLEPRLFFFTISFAGFWLMFYQLFDILPNFVDDWVDSRGPAQLLISIFGEAPIPTVNGGNLTQEWIINFNALLISIFAFAVAYYTGKVRSLVAIVVGIAVSALGILMLGWSMIGGMTLLAIGVFSFGEMMASPTKMRYLAGLAPPGRKGQYMGYVNMTVGIGWSIGSIIAGNWYQQGGDKIVLARRYLEEELSMPADAVGAIDRAEVMDVFLQRLGVDAWQARQILWEAYEPQAMWMWFTMIGIASMLLLVAYDRVVARADRDPTFSFNTHGRRWVQVALVPILAGFAVALWVEPSPALWILAAMFASLFLFSFVPDPAERTPREPPPPQVF